MQSTHKLVCALLLGLLSQICFAQPFSFVGLKWGDPYETVNEKLVAGGFSRMLELVIQQSEPQNATKVRLFEGGRLLKQPARGSVVLSNNRLVGVQVVIKADPGGLDALYESTFASLRSRYGSPTAGGQKHQAQWGSNTSESLVLGVSIKDSEVVLLYRSREWHLLDQTGKKQDAGKF